MSCKIFTVFQGDRFALPLRLEQTGMDWTGLRVRAVFKKDIEDEDAVVVFDSVSGGTAGTSVSTEITSPGVMTVLLVAPEALTIEWPTEGLVGAVKIWRDTPLFGPYRVTGSLQINVKKLSL